MSSYHVLGHDRRLLALIGQEPLHGSGEVLSIPPSHLKMVDVYDSAHALGATNNMVSCEGPLERQPERPRTPQMVDKPLPSLPSLPSPTLTNPEFILPTAGSMHGPDSPESLRGPPSISYLRDMSNQDAEGRESMDRERPRPAKKEKRGLMSRKLMLLRSRTASNRQENTDAKQDYPLQQDSLEEPVAIASSPTIHDGDRLAPQSHYDKRSSIGASSFNSEEYAALPAFLSRYKSRDETEDEDTDTEKPSTMRMGYSCSIAGGADAQRKAQDEEEEQNSAMLSQRAEQILANAKKRLNLMEGNLRGARDLVAPLTAANLKRATSLGSSAASPASAYGTKRFLMDGYTNTRPGPGRILQMQASTPSLRRDYNQGHARTHSENALPERPHTALARGDMFGRKGRIPVRPSNSSWSDLRGSRSFESLGSPAQAPEGDGISGRVGTSPAAMGTPDLDLEPLPEESASQIAPSVNNRDSIHYESEYSYGLGISHSPSTTEGLKGQMSSLKNRISTLRERAKEDSIRRQSFNNLRDASPLNNAEYQAPEMWYGGTSDPIMDDAEAGADNTPSRPQSGVNPWGSLPLKTGSRNAFADIAAMQQSGTPTLRERRMQSQHGHIAHDAQNYGPHDRNRHGAGRDMPGSFDTSDNEVHSEIGAGADSYNHSGSDAPTLSTPDAPSEYFPDLDTESVYEDAEPDLPSSVVPHEQRADAFDYEHFFLHSAMQRYQQSSSPVNSDSDSNSVTSVSTAKGPTATATEITVPMHPDDELNPPPTPETPEALREIERKIAHSRSQSMDSVSTIASFATAAEQHGRASPTPIQPGYTLNTGSKPHSRRSSRAGAGVGNFSRPSSADPSVALARAPSVSTSTIRRQPQPSDPIRRASTLRRSQPTPAPLLSPLLSPAPVQDPTAIAVNALLDPQARALGLKDKALVFGVVESLRRVCEKLQEGESEEAYELKEWRRRMDGCRRVLEGE